jgi:hypothetical protein
MWSCRNARNTFQRNKDHVSGYLDFCFTFQDDLEVTTPAEEEHKIHLLQIF